MAKRGAENASSTFSVPLFTTTAFSSFRDKPLRPIISLFSTLGQMTNPGNINDIQQLFSFFEHAE